MSKFALFGLIVFVLMFVTYIVDMTTGYEVSVTLGDSLTTEATPSIVTILSMLKTFLSILTFKVDGMPVIINIGFYALSSLIAYMIIDVVKDIIPFT